MQTTFPYDVAVPPRIPKQELGGLTEREGGAWAAFLRGHARVVAQMSDDLEDGGGMPLTHYDVLRQLALAANGALRMSELADRVVLSRPGLTRLEAEGLVARRPSADDGRGLNAVLTARGRRRLLSAHPTHVRSIRERFASHYSDDELQTLATLLGRLGAP